MESKPASAWFSVRCLLLKGWAPTESDSGGHEYEERITLWQAGDIDEAIAKAEAEAIEYAGLIEDTPDEFSG